MTKNNSFILNCLLASLLLMITGAAFVFGKIGVLVMGVLSICFYTYVYFRLERLSEIQNSLHSPGE
jgi:Ca2+/Na+ antiporter